MMLQTATFQALTSLSSWYMLFQQQTIIADSVSARNAHKAILYLQKIPSIYY